MFASGEGGLNIIAALALAALLSLLALVVASLMRPNRLVAVGGPILIGWGILLFFWGFGDGWTIRIFLGIVPVVFGTMALLGKRKKP